MICKRISKAEEDRIEALARQGIEYTAIGERFGVSRTKIGNILKKRGFVAEKKPSRKELALEHKERIKDMYFNQGLSIATISRRLNVHSHVVGFVTRGEV